MSGTFQSTYACRHVSWEDVLTNRSPGTQLAGHSFFPPKPLQPFLFRQLLIVLPSVCGAEHAFEQNHPKRWEKTPILCARLRAFASEIATSRLFSLNCLAWKGVGGPVFYQTSLSYNSYSNFK